MDALTRAFIELSAGRADAPPRVAVAAGDQGLLGVMPSFVEGILATKLVSLFPAGKFSLVRLLATLLRSPGLLREMTQLARNTRFVGRKLETSVIVVPELIGGVRVIVGDEVLDTSIRARLEQMKAALTA